VPRLATAAMAYIASATASAPLVVRPTGVITTAAKLQRTLRRGSPPRRWRGTATSLPDYLAKDSIELQSLLEKAESCPPEGCLEDLSVKDLMDPNPITVRPDDSFLTALKILGTQSVTGLHVVDDNGKVVGQVSGYDLLALDCTPGGLRKDSIFPSLDMDEMYDDPETMWKEFTSRRDGIEKETARTVGSMLCICPVPVGSPARG